jgi:hypothetical protein
MGSFADVARLIRVTGLWIVLSWNLIGVVGASDLDAQIAALDLQRFSGETVNAPDFAVTGLDNKEITLGAFKGRLVLLNFWATW